MNSYKIFSCNKFGKLLEVGQVEASTIQGAISRINSNYNVIGKVENSSDFVEIREDGERISASREKIAKLQKYLNMK